MAGRYPQRLEDAAAHRELGTRLVVWKSWCLTVKELKDAAKAGAESCSGHRGSRGCFTPRIWVAGSQCFLHPRGRRSGIGPCIHAALCYRVIYGVRQHRSRNAASSRTPF